MSVDATIRTALTPIVSVVTPNKYDGELKNYIVYYYNSYPDVFGDSTPNVMRYSMSIHWISEHKVNPNTTKKQICQALHNAGFTYPIIINASDKSCQHYVFECEFIDGEV